MNAYPDKLNAPLDEPNAPLDEPNAPLDQPTSLPSSKHRDARPRRRPEPPTKETIAELPPFDELGLDRIVLAVTFEQIDAARRDLHQHSHIGFDTESKPTFVRGEVSDGPHLVQFATRDRAYLLPLHLPECVDFVAALLQEKTITKVGFGLDTDRTLIAAKLGAAPRSVLDLDTVFLTKGYRRSLGLKSAVAIVFGRQFHKSKKTGTSNWASPQLNERQLRYAANDAYAAICVYDALGGALGDGLPEIS